MTNKKSYLELLSKSYEGAVEFLLKKYGEGDDDYYREESYNRFLDGEIKSITRGHYTRTSEGLYCHHIDEDKYENLSNRAYIKEYGYPFELQKKDRLVYCDLFEHAILHVLIAKETSFNFGISGYQVNIAPMIEEWYIDGKIPKPEWMKNCYDRAFLDSEETSKILEKMNEILWDKREEVKKEEEKKIKKFFDEGGFKDLKANSPRDEIIHAMYRLKEDGAYGYNNQYGERVYSKKYKREIMTPVDLDVFESRMKPYDLGGVLKNIQLYMDYKKNKISWSEYTWESDKNSRIKTEVEDERKAQEEEERLVKKKREKFYSKYPAFEKEDISYDLTRQEVNVKLFKYYDEYSCFMKFQGAMKEYDRDELLRKLYGFVKEG